AFRIPSGAKQVTVATAHVCALIKDKGVACWGSNSFAQFGNGSTDNSTVPVLVNLPSGTISGLNAGHQTTCASIDRKGWCWGDNTAYQGGSSTDSPKIIQPKLVLQLGQLTLASRAIVPSKEHTCALTTGGFACWGNNTSARLGSTNAPSMTAV